MVKESLLAPGEKVVFEVRAHWKNLVVPALVAVLTTAAVTFLLLEVVPSPERHAWQRWTVAAVGALVLLAFAVWPLVVWASSVDVLTTRRLISRSGVLTRSGKEVPVDRIHSVSYRRTVLDRVLGCGTLVVQTAGSDSDVELYDVAHIERRILQIQDTSGAAVLGDDDPPRRDRPDAG